MTCFPFVDDQTDCHQPVGPTVEQMDRQHDGQLSLAGMACMGGLFFKQAFVAAEEGPCGRQTGWHGITGHKVHHSAVRLVGARGRGAALTLFLISDTNAQN